MNCQTFETLITDLVRNGPGEEGSRSAALAHARSCARCAARLAGEQRLSDVIQLAAAEAVEAPAHVETAVLAAYRARVVASSHGTWQHPAPRFWGTGYWRIAAALLLTILGVAAFRLLQPGESDLPRVAAPVERQPALSVPELTAKGSEAGPPMLEDLPKVAATAVNARATTRGRRPSAARASQSQTEIATDFIPLVSREEISSMESGQVVRVLLPRSAMASFGLPVNQERADRPVTAQVLIGQDGVARAIRFLGDANSGIVQTGMQSKR